MTKVLAISAHPDDEILGCGGTLLKHRRQGDELYWLIVTCMTEEGGYTAQRRQRRAWEIEQISKRLGFKETVQLDHPAATLSDEKLGRLVSQIASVFSRIEPQRIYVTNRSDAHSDHRILFDAVASCTKSFRHPYVKEFLMYECLSETEFAPVLHERVFLPHVLVDISEFLEEKLSLMEVYESEVGQHPYPRSRRNIEALATYRGAMAGVEYAEAFQVIRQIW